MTRAALSAAADAGGNPTGSDGLRRDGCHRIRDGKGPARRPRPDSAIGRLRAFFERNPDEALAADDIALKFRCTVGSAYKMVDQLKREGFLVADGRRPTLYRRPA